MNAAATTGNPSPARTWNGSCPGTPTPEPSAPAHTRPRPDTRTGTAAITASPRTRSRRPLAYPITGLPNTYHRRSLISEAQRADAIAAYYEIGARAPYQFYSARCDGTRYTTTVLTKLDWLDLNFPLGEGRDHLKLVTDEPSSPLSYFGKPAADAAVRRLSEALAVGTYMVNAPLYRLLNVTASPEGLKGRVSLTSFVDYALTLDLLENELTDALGCSDAITPGALPLRDLYLPDMSSLIDLERRLCVGGPLALTAIAPSPGRHKNTSGDYVLLIHERSARVLNASARLPI